MPAQIADEGGGPKKPQSLKDINAEFQAQILTTKRERKKTTVEVDGHTVLKANNYSLEEGEQSVFAREVKQKKTEQKKARAQVAGRDYGHSYTCQVCWDGGDIVCCDLCPVSVHAECIGVTQNELAKATRWACPHHSCAECGRKAAAGGATASSPPPPRPVYWTPNWRPPACAPCWPAAVTCPRPARWSIPAGGRSMAAGSAGRANWTPKIR